MLIPDAEPRTEVWAGDVDSQELSAGTGYCNQVLRAGGISQDGCPEMWSGLQNWVASWSLLASQEDEL